VNDSQKIRFRELSDAYGLGRDDFFKAPQGFVIIKREGIEKIQRGLGIRVEYEVIESLSDVSKGCYVIKAKGFRAGFDDENKKFYTETFGESSMKNCRNQYPVAMAEKRALSRCVLKMADLYELGVKGEDEVDES